MKPPHVPKHFHREEKDRGLRAFHKSIICYYTALTSVKNKKNRTEHETTIINKGLKVVLIKKLYRLHISNEVGCPSEKPFYS